MLEEDADHQSENASNNQEGTFPPLDLPQLTTEARAEKVCASKASVKVRDVSCTGSLPVTTDNDMPANHQPSPMKSVHLIPDLINRSYSAERSPNFQHVHNDKNSNKVSTHVQMQSLQLPGNKSSFREAGCQTDQMTLNSKKYTTFAGLLDWLLISKLKPTMMAGLDQITNSLRQSTSAMYVQPTFICQL